VRQAYSDWVLERIWNDPRSTWQLRAVAEKSGMDLAAVQESVEWIPSGSPWLDKYAQIQGDELGISIGLDNAIDAARRRGRTFSRTSTSRRRSLHTRSKKEFRWPSVGSRTERLMMAVRSTVREETDRGRFRRQ